MLNSLCLAYLSIEPQKLIFNCKLTHSLHCFLINKKMFKKKGNRVVNFKKFSKWKIKTIRVDTVALIIAIAD